MTFAHPWMLLLLALPLLFLVSNRRGPRYRRLAIPAASAAMLVVALGQPKLTHLKLTQSKLTWTGSNTAVMVLADTSPSVSDKGVRQESDFIRAMKQSSGKRSILVVPFTRTPQLVADLGQTAAWPPAVIPGVALHASGIGAAIRDAMAAFPTAKVGRIVITSDGRENTEGSIRAVEQARRAHVPIDTIPLAGQARPQLRLETVAAPAWAFTNEKFPVDIAIRAPWRTVGEVVLSAGNNVSVARPITLVPGTNDLRLDLSIESSGKVDLSLAVAAPRLGESRFSRPLVVRPPRVVLLSRDRREFGSRLTKTLESAHFDVTSAATVPDNLGDGSLLVLDHWDLQKMSAARKAAAEAFVKRGGGLAVIGGSQGTSVATRRYEDALERTLPVRIAPAQMEQCDCHVMVFEKSASMDGKKLALAKLTALSLVENLRRNDMTGMLVFDDSFRWAVPIRKADVKDPVNRVIEGVTAGGGTRIAPALREAVRRIVPVNCAFKQIVLFTDGVSEDPAALPLVEEAAARGVTISTVALGDDSNRNYLDAMAKIAHGQSHFIMGLPALEAFLARKPIAHGSTLVTGGQLVPPRTTSPRFIPKAGAEVRLRGENRDPVAVRWCYGRGRVEILTAEATERGSNGGFDRFWRDTFRDVLPHAQTGKVTVAYGGKGDELIVDYRISPDDHGTVGDTGLVVIDPQGSRKALNIQKLPGGLLRARVRLEHAQGPFRIGPLAESRAFPEVWTSGLAEEIDTGGPNEALLRRISEVTGGRFNPSPLDVLNLGSGGAAGTPLWPLFVAFALGLNLLALGQKRRNEILDPRVAGSFTGSAIFEGSPRAR